MVDGVDDGGGLGAGVLLLAAEGGRHVHHGQGGRHDVVRDIVKLNQKHLVELRLADEI